MSIKRKIAHNTLVQIVGKGISTALGLVAFAMMTHYLGTEQFGWYTTAISFLQFIGIIADFGLIPVTAQMLSEPTYPRKKLLDNLFTFRLVTAVVAFGLAPVLVLLFPYPPIIKMAVLVTSISFFAISLNQIFTGFYQEQLKMHWSAIGEVVGKAVLVLGMWMLISQRASFLPIMALVSIASIAQTIYLWIGTEKLQPIRLAVDLSIWKAIAKKSWPIAISIMFNVVYLRGDIVLLSLMAPQAEVGIYGAAYRVIDLLNQIAMLLMGVMLPLLTFAWARKKKKLFQERVHQSMMMLALFAFPLVVGTMTVSYDLMRFVSGDEFYKAGLPLRVLMLAVLGVFFAALSGHIAVAINKQKETLWVYISNAILTLIGYLYFIPKFGMMGAAWMSVFSELYTGATLFVLIYYWTKVSAPALDLLKILIASLLMIPVLYIFQNAHLLHQVTIGAMTYILALGAFRIINKDTIGLFLPQKSS